MSGNQPKELALWPVVASDNLRRLYKATLWANIAALGGMSVLLLFERSKCWTIFQAYALIALYPSFFLIPIVIGALVSARRAKKWSGEPVRLSTETETRRLAQIAIALAAVDVVIIIGPVLAIGNFGGLTFLILLAYTSVALVTPYIVALYAVQTTLLRNASRAHTTICMVTNRRGRRKPLWILLDATDQGKAFSTPTGETMPKLTT